MRGRNIKILAGQQDSETLDMLGVNLRGLIFPANWDAVDVSILASIEANGTFLPVHRASDGEPIEITGVVGAIVLLSPNDIVSLPGFIKFRSALAQTDEVILIPIVG